jgi:hypothetical protein
MSKTSACARLPPQGAEIKLDKLAVGTFGALAAAKIALLVVFGPVFTPDSAAYVAMAETMRASDAWLYHVDLGSTFAPAFAFRIIGYPAVVAAAMTVAGTAWPYVLVVIQSAISLIATAATLQFGRELGLDRRLALIAAVAGATSMQFTLDQCILTDSLNASFIILATVLIVRGVRAGRPLGFAPALAAGILIVLAFLLREVMQVLVVLFVPLLVVRVVTAAGARLRTCAAAVLVVLPLLVTVEAYKQWNVYRTGERFVTTGGQTTLLEGLVVALERNPGLFDADTPLDRALRSHIRYRTLAEIVAVNEALFHEGFKATDIARLVTARYLAAWREHPLAMLSMLRSTFSENQAKLAVRPVTAACEIIEWGHSEPQCPDYRDTYQKLARAPGSMTPADIAIFVTVTVQNTASIIVFAAFLIGVPVLVLTRLGAAWRRRKWPPDFAELLLAGALWALYCGWDMAYSLIHFENRYLAPVIPLSVFGGLLVIQELARLRGARAQPQFAASKVSRHES